MSKWIFFLFPLCYFPRPHYDDGGDSRSQFFMRSSGCMAPLTSDLEGFAAVLVCLRGVAMCLNGVKQASLLKARMCQLIC